MKTIARILAPAALVLASFSASAAGLIETDYPLDQQRYGMTQAHQHDGTAMHGSTAAAQSIAGVLELDYPAVQPRQTPMPAHASPNGTAMQRQATDPSQVDLGYFA